jgi:hypothetical protein
MPAILSRLVRPVRLAAIGLAALALAACDAALGPGGPAVNTSRAVPVALLVPYGSGDGNTEALARSLENAARLAIADLGGGAIELTVYPTAGRADAASASARQAVADGAKVILGPLFAEAANAAARAAAPAGVNVLSFSNNTDIAGGNLFVLGNTFDNTAERLLGYAAAQGRNRVMVVHDQNVQGEVGRRAVERAAAGAGAAYLGAGSFEFSQQGVVDAVGGIADMARSSGANAIVFTSDSAGALPLVTQLLRDNRIDATTHQFIGLTRWDIPAGTLALPGVQGGWFALPDPAMSSRFEARYAAAYGAPPHPLAGLAYDGIAAIGALLKTGRSDALTRTSLTQGSGFVGVNGVFRLRADGTNQRSLAIARIENGEARVIDPAPRSFGSAGF